MTRDSQPSITRGHKNEWNTMRHWPTHHRCYCPLLLRAPRWVATNVPRVPQDRPSKMATAAPSSLPICAPPEMRLRSRRAVGCRHAAQSAAARPPSCLRHAR
eukprot:1845198-Prymnesium_polylepis.1